MPYPSEYQASVPWTQERKGICHVTYEQGKPHREDGEEEQESTHQPHHQSHEGESPHGPATQCVIADPGLTRMPTPLRKHTLYGRATSAARGKVGRKVVGKQVIRAGQGRGRRVREGGARGLLSRLTIKEGGGERGRERERSEEGGVHADPPLPSHHAPSLATVNIVPILVFCLRTRT